MTQQPIVIPEMEEEEDKDLELRSEEVKEIMGNPPSWIIRWGTTVAFGAVILLLFFAWWVQWPDVRDAQIELTTAIPPAEVVSTMNGNVESILVKPGEAIKKGDLVAVMQSTGDFSDILLLREDLLDLQEADELTILNYEVDEGYQLGDLASAYTTLVTNFEDYSRSKTEKFNLGKIDKLRQTKRAAQQSIRHQQSALTSLQREWKNANDNVDRVQKLYLQKIKSRLDLEKASSVRADAVAKIQSAKARISDKKQEISRIDKDIINLRDTKQQSTSFNLTRVKQEIIRLKSSIDSWEEKYLIKAPIDGTVSFPDVTSENKYMKRGEPILNILPDKGGGWICVGQLATAGSAKVERGQEVLLKFENYPYEEFGSVRGVVNDIALMPRGNSYRLEVGLTDGLNTTQGRTLNHNQGMTGLAEITVEERRLLEMIFDKFLAKVREN